MLNIILINLYIIGILWWLYAISVIQPKITFRRIIEVVLFAPVMALVAFISLFIFAKGVTREEYNEFLRNQLKEEWDES